MSNVNFINILPCKKYNFNDMVKIITNNEHSKFCCNISYHKYIKSVNGHIILYTCDNDAEVIGSNKLSWEEYMNLAEYSIINRSQWVEWTQENFKIWLLNDGIEKL